MSCSRAGGVVLGRVVACPTAVRDPGRTSCPLWCWQAEMWEHPATHGDTVVRALARTTPEQP
ncbi:hypothetical protein ACFVTZ_12175 [Cellulosimicrobium cellulans]|uniref:hypothetical protein n=1 Tax=Cellulosimicrobium cellulans TaxID=1710 RepID=UPI0036E5A869